MKKIAYVTEDRRVDGLALKLSVKENMASANLKGQTNGTGIFIDEKKEAEICDKYVKELSIKISSVNQPIGTLSGGNQQKVFLARWLNTDAEILLLDNPTQGIDVGAKAEIYKLILELAKQGKTILINTLEIPEIQKVADYCAVFYNGEIIKVLEHQEIDEMTVMMYSTNAAQTEEGK